jgi:hypothetical protein
MGEVKHTRGPWTVIPARAYDGDDPDLAGSFESFASIEGADGSPVCVFGDAAGSATMFENEADYRLISAAPELLAVLREIFVEGSVQVAFAGNPIACDALEARARAAIAKATGEQP